eukprot:gene15523-biopygen1133
MQVTCFLPGWRIRISLPANFQEGHPGRILSAWKLPVGNGMLSPKLNTCPPPALSQRFWGQGAAAWSSRIALQAEALAVPRASACHRTRRVSGAHHAAIEGRSDRGARRAAARPAAVRRPLRGLAASTDWASTCKGVIVQGWDAVSPVGCCITRAGMLYHQGRCFAGRPGGGPSPPPPPGRHHRTHARPARSASTPVYRERGGGP